LRAGGAGAFPPPSEFEDVDLAIVGGGMSGLVAAWRAQKRSRATFALLELEPEAGGNARGGAVGGLAYPWGAHYVPALAPESTEAIELLQDLGAIKGRDAAGTPIYDEYFLCHAPHERLFMNGRWQDGLLPLSGASVEDRAQMASFLAEMAGFSQRRGHDGRMAFAIPVDRSSRDPELVALDAMTMGQWMSARGYGCARLRWYVDYCCRDDFGTPLDEVSAWASIHYFAARRGQASGEAPGQVLTWPEGNAWIARRLAALFPGRIRSRQLVYSARALGAGVEIESLSLATGRSRLTRARAAILACPRFASARILRDARPGAAPGPAAAMPEGLSYAPWMVANVHLSRPPQPQAGAALSWDNVLYGSRSLGYVVATNQIPQIYLGKTVLTYYLPLDGAPPARARAEASQASLADWQDRALADLEAAHPGISRDVERVDAWVWGHAMARPVPGFVWGPARQAMAEPVGSAYFAHTDMSGLSLFEEACYQGARAADKALRHV
jgi:hypothetical protein